MNDDLKVSFRTQDLDPEGDEYVVRKPIGCTLMAFTDTWQRTYHCYRFARPCEGCVYKMPADFILAMELVYAAMIDNLKWEDSCVC